MSLRFNLAYQCRIGRLHAQVIGLTWVCPLHFLALDYPRERLPYPVLAK